LSSPCVYILANRRRGTLYIGVTRNLVKRIHIHKNENNAGFTKKYQIKDLVYYEIHLDMSSAITREKQLKKWERAWKIQLIERFNPEWLDLFKSLICE